MNYQHDTAVSGQGASPEWTEPGDYAEAARFVNLLFADLPGHILFYLKRPTEYRGGRWGSEPNWWHRLDAALDGPDRTKEVYEASAYAHSVNVHSLIDAQVRISTVRALPTERIPQSDPQTTGSEELTAYLPALFADVDDAPMSEMLARLSEFDPRPSLVVQSSANGLHVYWLLTEPVSVADYDDWGASEVKRIWRGLCDVVGSVRSAAATTVWARLPGTINPKPKYGPEYPVISLIHEDWSARYSLSAFERYALPEPEKRPSLPLPPGERGRLPEFAQSYIDNPPGPGSSQRNVLCFEVACQLRDARYTEAETLQILSSWQQPGFSFNEIRHVVRHVWQAPPRQALPTRQANNYHLSRQLGGHRG